jgi:hypothetical protein
MLLHKKAAANASTLWLKEKGIIPDAAQEMIHKLLTSGVLVEKIELTIHTVSKAQKTQVIRSCSIWSISHIKREGA